MSTIDDRLNRSDIVDCDPQLNDSVIYESGPQVYSRFLKSSVPNISHDLQRLDIEPDVIMLACDELSRLNMRVRRGTRWMTMIYHCLDVAYRELSIPIEPRILAEKLGITLRDVNRFEDELVCSSIDVDFEITDDIMYDEDDSNESEPDENESDESESDESESLGTHNIIYMDPCYYIEHYCDKLEIIDKLEKETNPVIPELADKSFDDHLRHMMILSDLIKDYIDDYPQVLAAGVIQYYCDLMNIEYDKEDISDKLRMSLPSISKVVRILKLLTSDT